MAVFISKFKKYSIWLKPARTMHDAFGGRHREDGLCAKFEENKFQTDDKEIIELLKQNPRYGLDFRSTEQEKNEQLSEKALASKAADESSLDTVVNSCPFCEFKAANKAGLNAHIRAKHKDK